MDEFRHDQQQHRYVLVTEGHLAFIAYEENGNVRTFTHTFVPPPVEGRGIGTRLVLAALQDLRANGLKLASVCPFVTAYLQRHPEWADLAA